MATLAGRSSFNLQAQKQLIGSISRSLLEIRVAAL